MVGGPVQINSVGMSFTESFVPRLGAIRAWMLVVPVDALLLLLPILWTPEQWKALVVQAGLSVLLLTEGSRYRARLHLSVLDDLPSLLGRLLTASAAVGIVIALRHEQEAVTLFLTNVAISTGLVLLGRVVTTQLVAVGRRSQVTRHRVVLIGGGPLAADLAEIIRVDHGYGLEVVGYVEDGPQPAARAVVPELGKLADLDSAVHTHAVDVLVVVDGDFTERDLLDAVRSPTCAGCDLLVVPRMHHFHTRSGTADHIGSIPIMRIAAPTLRGPARVLKRTVDVVVSAAALVLLAPVLAACALASRAEGGPGVLFRQARVGRDGRVFDCLKIRTMRPEDPAEAATTWSVGGDSRVGPAGRLMRRTSLDELPQFWNILRGDMSLVGPRPERPFFVSRFSEEFDRYRYRHRVQAGLTGLAQVSGLRGDTSIADRARYDNFYIENWTLWLDVKIFLRTFAQVVLARGK